VKTPNLDALAAAGVRFARHYSQAAPCGPGRASLYTGLYQMNHRVVANGTPLDRRFDNIAKAARRAGYVPTLFGYTDQSIDPRDASGPDDPRLQSYEGILPGFEEGCHLPSGASKAWTDWLATLGYDVPSAAHDVLTSEPLRAPEHSMSAFLTDRFLDWQGACRGPWFAHLSQLRPHPPYAAAGAYDALYDPAAVAAPIAPSQSRHWLHEAMLHLPQMAAPRDDGAMRALKARYFGMISEVDFHLGRIWDALRARGQWDDTFIVVTSDHGEQLGDHGLLQMGGFFEASYHVPLIVRDPRQARAGVVDRFTEAVDIFPTLCEAMGIAIPAQCDGLPLTPLLKGEAPPWWRNHAHWEFDWRMASIPYGPFDWPWDRRLERQNLTVIRSADAAFVQFADGDALAFDCACDPTWRTPLTDPAAQLALARAMLAWRAEHADRTLTGFLVENGGIGRQPDGVA
jgi:arylsulfatase A-like enzyme